MHGALNAASALPDGAAMLAGVASAPTSPAPGIVACSVYARGRRVADIPLAQAGEWSRRAGHVVWIGLLEPAEELLREVQAQFDLHPLAIEDAGKPHLRPKLEQYGDGLFVIARTAQLVEGRIAFGETHLFLGPGYVVSVRHGASTSYTSVRQHAEACPNILSRGEYQILYAILDFIVENYSPVLEAIHDEVERIEDGVLARRLRMTDIERLYMLRRDLLRLRNAVVPLVEVLRRLEHTDVLGVDPTVQLLFRDVTEHVRRVQEDIDSLREVLAFAFEASLMTGQTEQNEVSRRLAAWAAILAVPTAVAGIYGMNFEFIPELKWQYGYFACILVIVTVCATLYYRFRQNGWL
jgi:magnesium transporter